MMIWEMEAMVETEALLETIWDIHNKLSDAIHTITRSHFQKSLNRSLPAIYTKDFHVSDDDDAISEARSLSAIRSALENLEDQIESFHTFKSQQWAERYAAIARLEQSRNVLAKRLADHHGKKSKVIEEALTLVVNLKDTSHFVMLEKLIDSERKRPNLNLVQAFVSSLSSAKKSLKLKQIGGLLGHAALIAVGVLAFLQLHQATSKDDFVLEASQAQDDSCHMKRGMPNVFLPWFSPSRVYVKHLDVLLARG